MVWRTDSKMKNKKSQLTLFVIIGIVIMVFFGSYIALKMNVDKKKAEKDIEKVSVVSESVPVKNYVEGHIKDLGMKAVKELGKQGGYLNKSLMGVNITIIETQVPVYLDNDIEYDRPNITEMEDQLAGYITEHVDEWIIHFEASKKSDYEIINPKINKTEVIITKKDITINVDYSFILDNEDVMSELHYFSTTVPVRLMTVYNVTNALINNMTKRDWPLEQYNITLDCDYIDSIADNLTLVYLLRTGYENITRVHILDAGYYNKSIFNDGFPFDFIVNNTNITGKIDGGACNYEE